MKSRRLPSVRRAAYHSRYTLQAPLPGIGVISFSLSSHSVANVTLRCVTFVYSTLV